MMYSVIDDTTDANYLHCAVCYKNEPNLGRSLNRYACTVCSYHIFVHQGCMDWFASGASVGVFGRPLCKNGCSNNRSHKMYYICD